LPSAKTFAHQVKNGKGAVGGFDLPILVASERIVKYYLF
jgi:hypothetical protein